MSVCKSEISILYNHFLENFNRNCLTPSTTCSSDDLDSRLIVWGTRGADANAPAESPGDLELTWVLSISCTSHYDQWLHICPLMMKDYILYFSFSIVCVCDLFSWHVCVQAYMWGPRLKAGLILHCPSTLLIETGSLSPTRSVLMWLV